jgi:hypothetical protein
MSRVDYVLRRPFISNNNKENSILLEFVESLEHQLESMEAGDE